MQRGAGVLSSTVLARIHHWGAVVILVTFNLKGEGLDIRISLKWYGWIVLH